MSDKFNKLSNFLKKFRCIKCNEIDYSYMFSSGPKINREYICESCLKIDNRDCLINEILN